MQQLLSCVCQSTILKRGKNRILNAAEILGKFMSNSVITLVIAANSITLWFQRQKRYVSFRRMPGCYYLEWVFDLINYGVLLYMHHSFIPPTSDCWICWWQSGKLNRPETFSLLPKTPLPERPSDMVQASHSQDPNPVWKAFTKCQDFAKMWVYLPEFSLGPGDHARHFRLLNLMCKCCCITNDPSWIGVTYQYPSNYELFSYINNLSVVNWSMTLNSRKWSRNQTHKLILWHLSYKYFWDYSFAVYLQLDYILRTGVLISQRHQSKLSLINTQTISEAVLQYLVQWSAWNRKAL